MTRKVAPPSGHPPPETTRTRGGESVPLLPLAEEICRRYRDEFPDEQERYGDAGVAWCVHDNQHILNWAFLDDRGFLTLDEQVAWLARVLEARDFPVKRLVRDLEIAAEVVEGHVGPEAAGPALRLRASADSLRPD